MGSARRAIEQDIPAAPAAEFVAAKARALVHAYLRDETQHGGPPVPVRFGLVS